MKKIAYISLLLFFIISSSMENLYSQSGWYLSQTNLVFRGLHKIGNMLNIACEGGAVLRTTDNGSSWKYIRNTDEMNSQPHNTFFCIYFFNESTGIVAGSSNILKTTNKGNTWVSVNSTSSAIWGMDFINSNTGFAVGGVQYPYNVFLKTTNQGMNWISISKPTSLNFTDIKFINTTTGFVVGDSGLVMKSTNSGDIWNMQKLATPKKFNTLFFINDNTGWIGGDSGKIFKTTNSGLNWFPKSSNTKYDINRIYFIDINNGIIAADSGTILLTNNGGNSWQLNLQNPKYNFYSAINTNNNKLLVFGGNSNGTSEIFREHAIYESTNNGANWNKIISGNNSAKTSVFFLDTLTGYVGGKVGTLMKTIDGGITWNQQDIPSSTHINYIQFMNKNLGWIVNYPGWFSRTTNGGESWTLLSSFINGFKFIDSLTGFGLGGPSWPFIVYKTSNSGFNWDTVGTIPPSANIIFFSDRKHGWISGKLQTYPYHPFLYGTTNSGVNWNVLPINISTNSIFFKDSLNGWFSSSNNYLYKSTDGGYSWASISNFIGEEIYFPSYNIGFLTNSSSAIFKTINSGINWYPVYNNSNIYNWHGMHFVNQNFGCMTAEISVTGYVVLTRDGGGTPIGVNNENNESPNFFSLSQNYPNPFNPTTTIRFDIPPSRGVKGVTNVRIVVYDLLGREIEELLNEEKKPGSYELTWDGSRFASGVYFYQLITDEFIETKKMLMVK